MTFWRATVLRALGIDLPERKSSGQAEYEREGQENHDKKRQVGDTRDTTRKAPIKVSTRHLCTSAQHTYAQATWGFMRKSATTSASRIQSAESATRMRDATCWAFDRSGGP